MDSKAKIIKFLVKANSKIKLPNINPEAGRPIKDLSEKAKNVVRVCNVRTDLFQGHRRDVVALLGALLGEDLKPHVKMPASMGAGGIFTAPIFTVWVCTKNVGGHNYGVNPFLVIDPTRNAFLTTSGTWGNGVYENDEPRLATKEEIERYVTPLINVLEKYFSVVI